MDTALGTVDHHRGLSLRGEPAPRSRGVLAFRGKEDLELVRADQKLVVDELARRIRLGLEESRTRAVRAQQRLGALRKEATANVQHTIDELAREALAIKKEAEERLLDLRFEVTATAQAEEEALTKRMRRVEGSIRVLGARAEIRAAEYLADAGEFADAEDLLEDAVAKVREAKLRLADDDGQEGTFEPVIDALHDAIHAIRERALDHKRQIDSVLTASDSLLASLRAREVLIVLRVFAQTSIEEVSRNEDCYFAAGNACARDCVLT